MFSSFPQHLIMPCGQTDWNLNPAIIDSYVAHWKPGTCGSRARMETGRSHNHLQYKMDTSLPACEWCSSFTWETLELDHREITCDAEWHGKGVNDLTSSMPRQGNWRVSTMGQWGNCQIDGRGFCFRSTHQLKTLAQCLLTRHPGGYKIVASSPLPTSQHWLCQQPPRDEWG